MLKFHVQDRMKTPKSARWRNWERKIEGLLQATTGEKRLSAAKSMIASVSRLLKKIDDLRSAAVSARALAEHFDGAERGRIVQLATDWDSQADQEEKRLAQQSAEAEGS